MKRARIPMALLVTAAGAVAAVSVAPAFARHAQCTPVTVKAMSGEKVAINQYFQDNMHFAPGTVTVKSGCMLTFEFGSADQTDPHTLTIVDPSQLPKTTQQIDNCQVCQQIGGKHLMHPTQPPGPTNPIMHWSLDAGSPGLDSPGDSYAIQEGQGAPPGHKSVTVQVTAPAGTALHFMCLVHPWMQGTITVT